MQEKFLAVAEVEDGDAEDAVEVVINVVNRGFEFLPQDVLFGGGLWPRPWRSKRNKKYDAISRRPIPPEREHLCSGRFTEFTILSIDLCLRAAV